MLAVPSAYAATVAVPAGIPQSMSTANGSPGLATLAPSILGGGLCNARLRSPRYTDAPECSLLADGDSFDEFRFWRVRSENHKTITSRTRTTHPIGFIMADMFNRTDSTPGVGKGPRINCCNIPYGQKSQTL